jgi:hypothetical protein
MAHVVTGGGDEPVEPRGALERDMNDTKSELESQGLFGNFYRGSPNKGSLVKMEMG